MNFSCLILYFIVISSCIYFYYIVLMFWFKETYTFIKTRNVQNRSVSSVWQRLRATKNDVVKTLLNCVN